MPNHVRTVIKIKGLNKKEVDQIMNNYTMNSGDGVTRILDFDKIIPEPRRIEDCPKDCIRAKDSCAEEDKDRPWFDWYTWRNKYWNTKWGAYDGYTKSNSTSVTFVFSTAWSPAIPIFERLTRLNHDMDVKYADEDLGNNCGRLRYIASECAWQEFEFKDLRRYARDVWNNY